MHLKKKVLSTLQSDIKAKEYFCIESMKKTLISESFLTELMFFHVSSYVLYQEIAGCGLQGVGDVVQGERCRLRTKCFINWMGYVTNI